MFPLASPRFLLWPVIKSLLDEVEQNILICQRRADQIIYLRDTDKSRYFATTEFNNCFIIRSPSLFRYFNNFLAAQGSDLLFFFSRDPISFPELRPP